MSLPIRNLDDRAFQQLVDEAKRKIPVLCPEWTNHNVSDPGVALIELFAWMTEMAIFRLNQVPDIFYTHMLNLLGFEQFPAKAARTDLTFWLTTGTPQSILIPAGTQVGTVGILGEERVFSTLDDVVVAQPRLQAALTQATEDGPFVNVWEDLNLGLEPVTVFPGERPRRGACCYFGFEDSLAGYAVNLSIVAELQGIGVVPDAPPLEWETWNGSAWVVAEVPTRNRLGQRADTTGGLNRAGELLVLVPKRHERLTLLDIPAFWLRVRLTKEAATRGVNGDRRDREAVYDTSPQLRSVVAATVGGIAAAEHSVRVNGEVLGTSNGKPGQVVRLRHAPVLERERIGERPSGSAPAAPADPMWRSLREPPATTDDTPGHGLTAAGSPELEEHVVVIGSSVRTSWTEVTDFATSDARSLHYTVDSTTGEVRFGPRIRDAHGAFEQRGAIPPAGARIEMISYRHGGGAAGNVGPGTLRGLHETIPYIAAVTNLHATQGGVDAERVEEAKLRGPQWLRSGARAVTASDFERVAKEADSGVHRVRCVPPSGPGDPVRVLIVPKVEGLGRHLEIDDLDLGPQLFAAVRDRLDECRILGSVIELGTPYYQGVSVAAVITAEPARVPAVVGSRVEAALHGYIDPLTGGPNGEGWPFETHLTASAVIALLEQIDGVRMVENLALFEYDVRRSERLGGGKDVVTLERDSLFLSGRHRVIVR